MSTARLPSIAITTRIAPVVAPVAAPVAARQAAPRAVTAVPLVAIVVLVVLGVACGGTSGESTPAAVADCTGRPIRMAIASSLREIATTLVAELKASEHGIEIEPIFGASSSHARQIRLGAPIDILVSADAQIVDELIQGGYLSAHGKLEFARGQLALVASARWTAPEHPGLEAISSPRLKRIAIPSAAVPLGRYAHAWLQARGLTNQLAGKIVATEHARASLIAADAGHVDLAIVYQSDLRLAKTAKLAATIDSSEFPAIRYVAARRASPPSCSEVDEALAAWESPETLRSLQLAGFLAPGSARGR